MNKGVKELLEAIKACEDIIEAVKMVMKDGKIDMSDLAVLKDLAAKQAEILDGVKGLGEIPAEVKDLDLAEAMVVVNELVAAIRRYKAA